MSDLCNDELERNCPTIARCEVLVHLLIIENNSIVEIHHSLYAAYEEINVINLGNVQ